VTCSRGRTGDGARGGSHRRRALFYWGMCGRRPRWPHGTCDRTRWRVTRKSTAHSCYRHSSHAPSHLTAPHSPTRPQLVFLVMSYLTSSKNKTFHYITTLVRACAWKAAPAGATCRWLCESLAPPSHSLLPPALPPHPTARPRRTPADHGHRRAGVPDHGAGQHRDQDPRQPVRVRGVGMEGEAGREGGTTSACTVCGKRWGRRRCGGAGWLGWRGEEWEMSVLGWRGWAAWAFLRRHVATCAAALRGLRLAGCPGGPVLLRPLLSLCYPPLPCPLHPISSHALTRAQRLPVDPLRRCVPGFIPRSRPPLPISARACGVTAACRGLDPS
jgi:hypothetical protein